MTLRQGLPTIPAPYALPVSFAMFLAVGTVAAALHGHLPATGVLIACATIACVTSFAADPIAFVLLAGIGWLTTVGFSHPPYAQLRLTGAIAAPAAIVIGASALGGACLGVVFRWSARRLTLVSMGTYAGMRAAKKAARDARDGSVAGPGFFGGLSGSSGAESAIDVRRRLTGLVLGALIAERRSADAQAGVAERRFQLLAEAVPQMVWTADATGWIDWYNHRWYEYTGQTPQEAAGWGWQLQGGLDHAPVRCGRRGHRGFAGCGLHV